ncbi:MAG: DUF4268 domain-containing protein [Micrococcales bacterium]|nr:DUF4268 domain-containing protein [Micrococcales bacterium]
MSQHNLGRISIIHPRDIWQNEAVDFTPWLLDNADVLAELLGMDLSLDHAEHPVGDFSLDIIGRDVTTGKTVIVENQLEESDHLHLGQILTYAAGTDPQTIVWVAHSFRPEHREAIAWLNERTDQDTRFFAVEIQVVRIGDSPPAPNFKLVAQPNDWAKTVRASSVAKGGLSDRQRLYKEFWESVLVEIKARHRDWTRGETSRTNWIGMSAGRGANWILNASTTSVAVMLNFEGDSSENNAARYQALLQHKQAFEDAIDLPVEWDPMEGYKSARVATYRDLSLDITQRDDWNPAKTWLISASEKMRSALEAAGGVAPPSMALGDVEDLGWRG